MFWEFMILTSFISIAFWVTLVVWVINVVKKRHGKITGKASAVLFLLTLVMLVVTAFTIDTDEISKSINEADVSSSSEVTKKSSSSSAAKVSSSTSKSSAASSSVKKTADYDYSKVENGMTVDQVISAIGKQPTDRDDNAIYYDDEEFDFNDNKLIGASVKSVQDKIDKYYKDEEKAQKKQQKQQKKQKFVDDINNKIDELNQATQESSGIDVIQGIDHPYTHTYKVHLDSFMLEGNDRQIKSVLNSINSQFIEIFENNGKQIPVMHYDVNGTEIAKNKVMNPSEVKLEN